MKKIFFAAFPFAALSAAIMTMVGDPLPIGSSLPHPELKMKDISGSEVSLKESMKKNGLLVMFSCNTCPVVGKYQSRTIEAAKLANSKEIGVVLLNSNEGTRDDGESFEDMKNYGKQQGYDFSYVLDKDSKLADAFGAARTPEIFLFDKDGKLVYHGAIDDNPNGPDQVTRKHLGIAIDEMVNGKAVTTQQTKSVGCGIKRMG
jgi:hypothetical protein